MFHPRGPYFLLSNMSALKKQSPHINLFKATGLGEASISASSMARYEPRILFLRPLGGSFVILIPFYSIETGNFSLGMDVNHILKALPLSSLISSIIPSRIGMNEGAKWQFYNTTHSC